MKPLTVKEAGRKGGKSRSLKKAAAARKNGKLGGKKKTVDGKAPEA
jgi:hypothetical protein